MPPPPHHHEHDHGPGHHPPSPPHSPKHHGKHSPPHSPKHHHDHKHSPPPSPHGKHHHDHHDHHHPPHEKHHPHEGHQDSEEKPMPPPPRRSEEKKDDEEDLDVDVSNLKVEDDGEKQQQKKKPVFKMSPVFGGDGGSSFDHGNNRSIQKMTLYSDGHVVKGMEVIYSHGKKTAGSLEGDSETLELKQGEFITQVSVRSNKYVQSLAFKTNKGREFGPVGGKGWNGLVRNKDPEGEEVKVAAPFKFQLCGFRGNSGGCIDNIAFRWGSI